MAQASEVEGAAISQARSINIKARRISPGFCIQCASFDSWYVKGVPNRAPNCPKSCAALVFDDPHRAQKVLGHKNLRTTEIYLHELGVDRKAADVFESITNEITNGKSSTNEKRAYFLQ